MKSLWKIVSLLLIIAAMAGGAYLIKQSQDSRKSADVGNASVSILPAQGVNLKIGETVSMHVWVDSGASTDKIQGFVLYLDYDRSKLRLLGAGQGGAEVKAAGYDLLTNGQPDPDGFTRPWMDSGSGVVTIKMLNAGFDTSKPYLAGSSNYIDLRFEAIANGDAPIRVAADQVDTTDPNKSKVTSVTIVGSVTGDVSNSKRNGAVVTIGVSSATGVPCKDFWWFDNTNKDCGQKTFCGLFMYQGLQTFATVEECKAAVALVPTGSLPKVAVNVNGHVYPADGGGLDGYHRLVDVSAAMGGNKLSAIDIEINYDAKFNVNGAVTVNSYFENVELNKVDPIRKRITIKASTLKTAGALISGNVPLFSIPFEGITNGTTVVGLSPDYANNMAGVWADGKSGAYLVQAGDTFTFNVVRPPVTSPSVTPSVGPTVTPTPTVVSFKSCSGVVGALPKNKGNAQCDAVINTLDFEKWRSEAIDQDGMHVKKRTWEADFDQNELVNMSDYAIYVKSVKGL